MWKIAHPTLPRPDKPGSPWQTPGVTERLPGGLMTSTGCLPSAGVVELHTSQAPHGLCPPGLWAMGSCLGFQAPTRAELPPTLCQGPHELICTSGVTWLPMGFSKGEFSKNICPRENSHFLFFIYVWNQQKMRNWDFSQNGHFDSCLAAQLLSSLRNSSALTGTPEEERKTVAVTRTPAA